MVFYGVVFSFLFNFYIYFKFKIFLFLLLFILFKQFFFLNVASNSSFEFFKIYFKYLFCNQTLKKYLISRYKYFFPCNLILSQINFLVINIFFFFIELFLSVLRLWSFKVIFATIISKFLIEKIVK